MKKLVIFSFFIFIVLIPFSGYSISIGTAPGVMDLGEIEPGKTVSFTFYLLTTARNDMLVYLTPVPVHKDFYQTNHTGRFTLYSNQVSEEDIKDWITIINNPVLVSPSNVKVIYLPDGSIVRANAEVHVKLKVPSNAEPCYYAYSINLSPRLTTGPGRGVGMTTIAITRFIFVFKVKGDGYRKGKIVDIIAERESQNKARIDTLFKNTGKCTMSVRVDELELYNKFGNLTTKLSSGWNLVKPGETIVLSSYWVSPNLPNGTFTAHAIANYISGKDEFEKEIEIPAIPTVKIKPITKCEIPWHLILIAIIVGIALYLIDKEYLIYSIGFIFLAFLIITYFYLECIGIPGYYAIAILIIAGIIIYGMKK